MSTESEQGGVGVGVRGGEGNGLGFQNGFIRSLGARVGKAIPHTRRANPLLNTSTNGTNTPPSSTPPTTTTSTTSTTRIRYREQGVDELLQLKLHQAIAATDSPPPHSTIVLATGDGNASQFTEDGFLGPVRTALRKGWRVELYAWEGGLSRAWKTEFGDGSGWEGRFRVVGMEGFGADLMEV